PHRAHVAGACIVSVKDMPTVLTRQHDNGNPEGLPLIRTIIVRTIGEPHAHVRCLRLGATPTSKPQNIRRAQSLCPLIYPRPPRRRHASFDRPPQFPHSLEHLLE